ncbi:NADH dehydrogenase (ubiquinone) 1 alpha subcomplex 5 [Exophiala aquamarina CBS 119918]|uniref:NADH dehydrogenase (Ubiquinone) 1 alpha subcomplex 5 n=1 Tax=Exophiala aquamarina CBS 119918 TaxID=1182545 RepID=A0A072PTM0_9EURO|nr:NADH dehydrogenase (ubiquinone) 1 alpha subcomplex 5 [Exophiala aquamarina CBS 119918]KEF58845.1 NADH dehydrogenase (ubiquinone) 1 alpha subcomplex 5 [Exophiala aquamarina CBS 119918]
MRSTSRLLAAVKSASKYLEPNTPTGLTGLSTHPSPRPALIYTYKQTLKKLTQLPASSVYRQSTEALTKQRLAVIEATKPEGYDAWLARVRKQIDGNPEAFSQFHVSDGSLQSEKAFVEDVEVWDGQHTRQHSYQEGSNAMSEAEAKSNAVKEEADRVDKEATSGVAPGVEDLEKEPPLTRVQVDEIEQKIGAGLIEEVLQVAEGELLLVDELLKYQVWQDLEEPIPTGQWEYFERGDHA